jgi:hypothetical protein
LLCGYLVMGRAFAQVGVPGTSIFLGEVLVVAALAYAPLRATLVTAARLLFTPAQLHGLLWLLTVSVSFGVLQLLRGVLGGQSQLEAAKVFAFSYLPLFLCIGIGLHGLGGDLLRRLARVLPWLNAAYLGVFFVALGGVRLRLPFSAAPVITPGLATAVVIALMLCSDRPLGRRAGLLATNVFLLLFLQIRGDWLAVAAAVLVWAVFTRRFRTVLGAAAVAMVLLATVSAAGLSIPGAPSRGGAVNISEIAARAVAPLDTELAARLSPHAGSYAGTTEWRREWWNHIWDGVHADPDRRLLGYGYGYPLSDLYPQLSEELVRTPHSVFFFTLGYSGWLGVAVFAAFQGGLLAALVHASRVTANPFGVMLWVVGLAAGMFGNFYETPYNALPFYVLVGLALGPIAGELADAARTAAAPAARFGAHRLVAGVAP